MKAVFLLCALVVVVSARPEEQYTTKYDGVDYKEAVSNDRLFESYYKCVMDEGKCTAEGKELKSHIADALKTKCAKCSPKQQEGVRYVIGFMINNKPTFWKSLCEKYDPEGIYAKEYEEELKTVA